MLMSGGQLTLSETVGSVHRIWWAPPTGLNLTRQFASYGAIYQKQLLVYGLVRKRALATRRLPLKVYERDEAGRTERRDSPYYQVLRSPNPRHSGQFLWEWTSSTFDIYGEAFWLKVRGRDGQPAELWPLHPSNLTVHTEDNGQVVYVFTSFAPSTDRDLAFPADDIVHFKTYNPDSTLRGLSPLEPLRQTLVNEDAIRRASSAFWSNGARPGTILSHPGKLSDDAIARLKRNWDDLNAGADNFGRTAVLEEGLTPHFQELNVEELQYIESRKLNREEVCIAYDVPPPVVHILDKATFSNITEQMRSMYRDTMAPHLGGFEAALDQQLRPEFGDNLYAEFLMDEVLRGDFETRVAAWATAIQTGQATPAEARAAENRPLLEGSDRLFINSALVPIDSNDGSQQTPARPANPLDSLWGRLGTYDTLDEIEDGVLTAGLNGHTTQVLALLDQARAAGDTIPEFRARLRAELS